MYVCDVIDQSSDVTDAEWTRHSSRTSTRTYTAADGSIITEVGYINMTCKQIIVSCDHRFRSIYNSHVILLITFVRVT